MNDSKTVVATLPSRPVTGRADKSVDLILRCKDHKIEAYIVWDEYMGSDDVTLKVRIGKTKAGEYLWGISTDHKATFCPGSAVEFVRKLLHADTLAVEATPYDENPITAVFDLKGIEETEAALRNVCPWK